MLLFVRCNRLESEAEPFSIPLISPHTRNPQHTLHVPWGFITPTYPSWMHCAPKNNNLATNLLS